SGHGIARGRLSHHRRGEMRSRPALFGVSGGIVAVSPVSASPEAPHHAAGGLRPRSAMPKRRRSAVSGVWSLRDPPVTRAGLLTADWPRGRGAAAYLTPNLSALLALCDGGLVRS